MQRIVSLWKQPRTEAEEMQMSLNAGCTVETVHLMQPVHGKVQFVHEDAFSGDSLT